MKSKLVSLPQLRVRTEFSFGRAFGPIDKVVQHLANIGCPGAAIADAETWGHVRWQQACQKAGVTPFFGAAVPIPLGDNKNPAVTVLAKDTRSFYRLSSLLRKAGDSEDPDFVQKAINGREGVVVLAGGLTDYRMSYLYDHKKSDLFDYVDIWPADRITMLSRVELSKQSKRPLVLVSDNYYPAKEDFSAFMAMNGREKLTPQWIMNTGEIVDYMGAIVGVKTLYEAFENTFAVASGLAMSLPTAPMIHLDGNLIQSCLEGMDYRLKAGHIAAWSDQYQERLKYELDIIQKKDFDSYFNVVADLVKWAKSRMLVGPARGSSGGSLVCYLLGITEIDPIVHGLLFERFIDMTRADLPDIDIDFSDRARDDVFTYLEDKYGKENVARLGSVNTFQPRSAINKNIRNFGVLDKDKFALTEVIDEGIQNAFDNIGTGREFIEKYPAAKALVNIEGHASHSGVHAAGVIVCNEPIVEYCTVGADGIAQIDKPDAESLNLLKIDALGLKTLGVIEDTGVVTAEELYALQLNDPQVFQILNDGKFAGVFQFEGSTLQSVCGQVDVNKFQIMDHLTALARPGPLQGGAAARYVERISGREKVEYLHPLLEPILNDTFGILLYQEQVMLIARDIGGFPIEDVTRVRKAISNKKGAAFEKELEHRFIAGAIERGMPRDTAADLWQDMVNFGGYGMNRAHTCAYSVVSYWCAWLKRYHPLHYAAAVLRGVAKGDNAETKTFAALREIAAEGVSYKAFDIDKSQVNWSVQDGVLVGGFVNLGGFGLNTATEAVSQRENGGLSEKMIAKIEKAPVKYKDLFPIQAQYAHIIADPYAHGCAAGSKITFIDKLPERGSVLMICQVKEKQLRNKNEAALIARRKGKRIEGPSEFLDLRVTDDTGGPFLVRIEEKEFVKFGKQIADGLKTKDDVILIRGQKLNGFSMVKAERIKCLTNPELI